MHGLHALGMNPIQSRCLHAKAVGQSSLHNHLCNPAFFAQFCRSLLIVQRYFRNAPIDTISVTRVTTAFTATLTVQDLRYFVDAPSKAKSDNQSKEQPAKLELLKGISGYACPGVLTALMGGSGTPMAVPPPPDCSSLLPISC